MKVLPYARVVKLREERQYQELCDIRRASPAYRAFDDPQFRKVYARWLATYEQLDLPLQTRRAAQR